ncbi:uncharacterized protein Z520_02017 [Fonsecaea multimorphosa CBS 102226]|uniref:Uncharacterized protein n=1 Tax=Fonsecaea multimorphosa CBS 102226 TaxID=1442371 RepID=A0A0D2KYI1_9EURO|nr:uncharacterized protein Z520_02017 [Fonsecaea multimorphosa CBS 102226]KIY01879.1 hypothetical protein Z520_02017 [Fonsecaea multimorphosa CBS 102226]OAL29564.1 hypothetical protein AYO22_01978 [Fonsecaea multimorphosa]
MSFKADGPKVRPERVKPPPRPPSPPTEAHPNPPSWPSRRSSTSSTTSFHSAHSVQQQKQDRFSPAEESRMLSLSNDLKTQANTFFSRQDYESAIQTYERALAELPRYLDYEMAVLQSNIAACHLKLDQWKDAVERCERGLDGLERELPTKKKKTDKAKKGGTGKKSTGAKKSSSTRQTNGKSENGRLNSDTESEDDEGPSPPQPADQAKSEAQDDTVVELPSDEEDESAALKNLQLSDTKKADITRIRVKLLLRRARARSNMSIPPPPASKDSPSPPSKPSSSTSAPFSAWSNLSSALEDYKLLSSTPQYWETLPMSDKRTVRDALVLLPPKIEDAKQKEVGEMMGKLKDLGNGILKPFGLSTDMFKVVQGEGGGYSLSFDGGSGGGGTGKKG